MIGNIYITGQIGEFDGVKGVNLIDIVGQVKRQPKATSLNVYIDSEGGYVHVGFDIYNYLRSLKMPITTIGRGIVASVATVIFMAGDKRIITEGTDFMIHLPWGEAVGTADDVERYAITLRDTEKQLLDFYKKTLNVEAEAIQPLLRDETYLSHEQLKTLGFITSEPAKIVAKAVIKSKSSNMTREEQEGLFNGFLEKIKNMFKPNFKAKLVQDANGMELNFEELADDAAVEIGAMATVDGQPANGEYILPSGEVYVFDAGKLTEIKPAEEDPLEMANARVQELETELEEARAQIAEIQNNSESAVAEITKEFNALKAKVMSGYKGPGKTNPDKSKGNGKVSFEDRNRAEKAMEYLNKKRNK